MQNLSTLKKKKKCRDFPEKMKNFSKSARMVFGMLKLSWSTAGRGHKEQQERVERIRGESGTEEKCSKDIKA